MSKMLEVKEQTFDVGTIAASLNIGAFSKDRLEISLEDTVNGFLIHAFTNVLEHRLAEDSYRVTFSYKIPSSWWQQLKLERSPEWYKNKYPVKYNNKKIERTVKITRKATYPMADVVVPKNFGPVVIKDLVSPLNFYEEDDDEF